MDRICREGVLAAKLRDSYDNATGHAWLLRAVVAPHQRLHADVHPDRGVVVEAGMVFHMYVSAMGLRSAKPRGDGPRRRTVEPRRSGLFLR